jgi:hypothetical protein
MQVLARAQWHWLIPVAVIAAMPAPILLTDRTFASDWGNHLWLIWVQGTIIGELGEPSYFLQSTLGAFYPYFAFYGGSLYALLGLVSRWSNPEVAVVVAYSAAFAAAYLGWTWIARQAGIRGWQMQLPGCIAVTAPYAVTNFYGRGDIAEAVATAAIPLVVASALSIVRGPRFRLPAAIAYVASVAVLTGTHTLTLLWGTTFLLLLAILLAAGNWRAIRARGRSGFALASLTVLGVGINAWILIPLVLYHSRLFEDEPEPAGFVQYTAPEHLFSLFRNSGRIFPLARGDINAELPVLAMVWALVCGTLYWRFLSRRCRRLYLGLLGMFGAILLLILFPSLIDELPRAWRFIQFPYRLLTYADLCLVGLVTLALAALQRVGTSARIPVALLAAIAVFSFGLAVDQNFKAPSWLSGRAEALGSPLQPPPSWYAPLQFADGSAPIVRPTLSDPLLVPLESAGKDRYELTYPPGPGGTARTNVLTGPYMVDVSGARPVGRTEAGAMVVRLPPSPRPRPVVVEAAWGAAMTVGRWLTIVSLFVAFAGALAYAAVTHMRRKPGTLGAAEP